MKIIDTAQKLTIKETIQYATAISFLFTGILLCFLSFFLNEYDIENGVLFYLGTATTFAGAVFGINLMIRNQVMEAETRIERRVNKKMEKVDRLFSDENNDEEFEN